MPRGNLPLRTRLGIGLLLSTIGLTQAASLQLQPQGDSLSLDGVADQTHGVLKWSHGAFLFVDAVSKTFSTLDREGRLVRTVRPVIPGASHLAGSGLGQFDRAPDGSIAFVAQAWNSQAEVAPILALISADGQTTRVVRTAPYWPVAVCFAPDGTVWALGHEMMGLDPKAAGVNKEGGVLRHFDGSGKLIAAVLPQSQFEIHQLHSGYLVATNDRVGWYGPMQGPLRRGSQYVEYHTDTMTTERNPGLPAGMAGVVEAFSLTESGEAFLTFDAWSSKTRTTYAFDRPAQKWVPVQISPIAGQANPHLLGSDGEQLVFKAKQSAQFHQIVP